MKAVIEEIKENLHTDWIGKEIVYLEETVSTNLDAKHIMNEGSADGTLVLTDKQTGGRGRRGRSWTSPSGTTICMTFGLKPDFEPDKASMLTIVMAYAVSKAVREVTELEAQIKWPNDIVVNGKKVCGILTEMNMDGGKISNVLIGVGINVNQPKMDDEFKESATSLFIESGKEVRRSDIIIRIAEYFEEAYKQFEKELNLNFLRQSYNEMLANLGRQVRVLDPNGEFEGTAGGINELGELLVTRADGQETNVYAGEVSVRGIYGYV